MADAPPLLSIRGLDVRFPTSDGDTTVVDGVDLDIRPREFFGVIGETGAGKSMTAWAATNLVPPPGRITAGTVHLEGTSVLDASPQRLQEIRGRDVSFIVQNPRAALNPMLTVGAHIADVYRAHQAASKPEALDVAIEALRRVGIPDPVQRARSYPHQLSGGMAQRVLIAMAMVNRPRLLIADEPTTGLDVTVQAEILDLMTDLVSEEGSAVWIITHDLGIIANYTQRAAVMLGGRVVETGPTASVFEHPRHPYTRALVRPETGGKATGGEPDGTKLGGAVGWTA
jgi:ABC-type dipeptide/oligopeptide/nickel transport system ATPase component